MKKSQVPLGFLHLNSVTGSSFVSEDTEVRKNCFLSGSQTEHEHYTAKFQLMCTPIQIPPLKKTLQVILLRHG